MPRKICGRGALELMQRPLSIGEGGYLVMSGNRVWLDGEEVPLEVLEDLGVVDREPEADQDGARPDRFERQEG